MSFFERPEGRLAVALGIGLVIGAERERTKGTGPERAPAGIRTFALVGLLGGVVATIGGTALVAVVGAIVGGIAIVGYYAGDRKDPGFTTEVVCSSPIASVFSQSAIRKSRSPPDCAQRRCSRFALDCTALSTKS